MCAERDSIWRAQSKGIGGAFQLNTANPVSFSFLSILKLAFQALDLSLGKILFLFYFFTEKCKADFQRKEMATYGVKALCSQ